MTRTSIETPRTARTAPWAATLVLALVAWTALAASMDNGHLGVFADDGLYLTSARSLRDGRGFGLPSRPGEPPPKYPIGLPAMIALALKLDPGTCSGAPDLGREVAIARAVVLVGGWGFFVAAFAWLRRVGVGPGTACGIVLATAFHHIVLVGGAITVFSDLPFAAIACALMWRWSGWPRSDAEGGGPARRALIDGAIAGLGVLVRTNGVTLVAAALVAAVLGRRRASALAACLVGAATVVVPATYYAGLHERVIPSNSYLLELKAGWTTPEAGRRVLTTNAVALVAEFPARMLASPANYSTPLLKALAARPGLDLAFRSAVSLVVGFGLVRLARGSRRADLPAWTHAAGSIAIFLIWPWTSIMDRLLMPLLPVVLLAYVRGVEGIAGLAGMGARGRRCWAAMALALVIAGNVAVVGRSAWVFHAGGRQSPGASHRRSLDEALGLIRDRTEPDAVIAAFWPEMVYLHTGRTVVPLVEDESILVGRRGDIARLKRWQALVAGRPFYVLARSAAEEGVRSGVDLPQLDALAADPGFDVREVARTADGRYRLSRVAPSSGPAATPGSASGSSWPIRSPLGPAAATRSK